MSDYTKPRRLQIVVCSECSQSWAKHLLEASRRLNLTRSPEDNELPIRWVDAKDSDVTLRECVELLLVINQGLIGKTGEQGEPGEQGEQGKKGDAGDDASA